MEWEILAPALSVKTDSKIILLVLDGVGGLPIEGKTELEAASTPHLDRLAKTCACGLTDAVFPGITPGSGPAHLSLFGYSLMKYQLGRGILEALGIGVEVGLDDLVARGNFATLEDGLIVDRRAGRIPTSTNANLCRKLNQALEPILGAAVQLFPGKEHRFVVKFSREGLSDALEDADPQMVNNPRAHTRPLDQNAEETADLVNIFLDRATEILQDSSPANTVLLRGFSRHPTLPTMQELYKLSPAAIANYPMYKGLAKLVGMDILETGPELEDLFRALEDNYKQHDFFFVHVKAMDAAGEDGDFNRKRKAIEQVDPFIPRLLALHPAVLVVTSDHSTPSLLRGHSWHPNPFMLHARTAFPDGVRRFTERECARGFLGRFRAVYAMPLMLAHAEKLKKYGA